jgi:23S rRNA (cytosine1962-C5)-methyltransferase
VFTFALWQTQGGPFSFCLSRYLSPMPHYPPARLRPERRKSVLAGHPWIFSGALLERPKVSDGSLVSLVCGDEVLGTGYYNSRTDIAVRLLSRRDEDVDAAFFVRRFEALRRERAAFMPPDTTAWRVAFAEADGCPGLIIDFYAGTLVAQFHTAGMDRLREQVLAALLEVYTPEAVVERSDLGVRKQEGLPDQPIRVLHGNPPGEVNFRENGHTFIADVLKGQKTGFFLDQRENRLALQRWCKGRSVLNVFSYSGGFSVYAAAAGAKRVVSLDASAPAMDLCRRNMAANGFKPPPEDFRTEDAFEALAALKPGEFDCIIIDPPSLAKSKKQLNNAIKAYTTLNRQALVALPMGGLLVSSSCTTHLDPLTFSKILHYSGMQANCGLKLLESKEQPFEHPFHYSFPEGKYLKFKVLAKSALLSS